MLLYEKDTSNGSSRTFHSLLEGSVCCSLSAPESQRILSLYDVLCRAAAYSLRLLSNLRRVSSPESLLRLLQLDI